MAVGANSGHGAFKDHAGIAETHAEHQMKKHQAGEGDEAEDVDPYEGLTTKEIAALKAQMGDGPLIDKPYEEMTTKEKLFMTFEDPGLSMAAGAISVIITCMILTSTACFIAETMPELAYQETVSDTCETPPCGVHEDTWGTIELCVSPPTRALPRERVSSTLRASTLTLLCDAIVWAGSASWDSLLTSLSSSPARQSWGCSCQIL